MYIFCSYVWSQLWKAVVLYACLDLWVNFAILVDNIFKIAKSQTYEYSSPATENYWQHIIYIGHSWLMLRFYPCVHHADTTYKADWMFTYLPFCPPHPFWPTRDQIYRFLLVTKTWQLAQVQISSDQTDLGADGQLLSFITLPGQEWGHVQTDLSLSSCRWLAGTWCGSWDIQRPPWQIGQQFLCHVHGRASVPWLQTCQGP